MSTSPVEIRYIDSGGRRLLRPSVAGSMPTRNPLLDRIRDRPRSQSISQQDSIVLLTGADQINNGSAGEGRNVFARHRDSLLDSFKQRVSSMRDSAGTLGPPRHEPDAPHAGVYNNEELASGLLTQPLLAEHHDPHSGSSERATSTLVAGWNVSNLIQGIGILGLPYACIAAGWVAIPAILLVALITGVTARWIGECLYERVDKISPEFLVHDPSFMPILRTRSTYACIAAEVWPRFGRRIVSWIVVTELFGATVLYLILLGNSMKPLMDAATGRSLDTAIYTACFGFAALPFVMIPRMRIIAWFSVVACCGLFASVVMVILYCLVLAPGGHMSWSNLPWPSAQSLPVALGIIVFSYCAHPVLPGIEGSMVKPQSYGRMISVSFAFAALVKILAGLLPALLFGLATKQVVVDNMTEHPRWQLGIHVTISLNVFFSLPLVVYVIGELLDSFVLSRVATRHAERLYPLWLMLNRCGILSLGLLIAIEVPHFALIMGLIGSVTGACLCFLLPSYFHFQLNRQRLSLVQALGHLAIFLFGCCTLVFGLVFSSIRLKRVYQDPIAAGKELL